MNQYSLLIGSFVRKCNFPLEANYIFPTESDLISFYEDSINNTILHEGLFKIVLDDGEGNLALYWVINEDDKLLFSKLISFKDIEELSDKLETLEENLNLEIEDRKLSDAAIYGIEDPTIIDHDLNSILKLSIAINKLRDRLKEIELTHEEIEESIRALAGTDEESVIDYLKTLDYLNLTEVSKTLHYFLSEFDEEKDTIDTFPELQAFLNGFKDSDTLLLILTDLWYNIQGDPLPTKPLRTLRGLQDFIEELKSYSINRMNNIQTELDLTLIGVGLSGDGSYNADLETYYLKNATSVMNALRTLDSLINQAINNCNLLVANTESVELDIKKESDKTTISAKVKLSSENGNDILVKNDGLYHNIDSEYENGILTIKVNGNIRQQHVLGISSIVDDAYYDTTLEAIVMIFRLHDGEKQTIHIPVANLVQEWIIDNSKANKVVELEKERVVDGPDKLSADVRLSSNKYNILEKDGNTLLVKGVADNIVYDGDVTVKSKLDSISEHSDLVDSLIHNLDHDIKAEIERAKDAEKELLESIDDEEARAINKETALDHRIDDLEKLVNDNFHDDEALENRVTTLEKDLDAETKRAKDSEHILQDNIDVEVIRATNEEKLINHRIDDLKKELTIDTSDISNLVSKTDLLALQIQEETNRATTVELNLSNEITNLRTTSETKDTELSTAIESEITRATTLESLLETRIETIYKEVNEKLDSNNDGFVLSVIDETTRATEAEQAISTELADLINKCIVSGTTTANDANIELAKLGTGYTTLLEVAQTLKSFLEENDFADSTINKWQEIQSFLSGITDLETLIGLLESVRSQLGTDKLEVIDLVNAEIDRAKLAERDLSDDILAENIRAEKEELNLHNLIDLETKRAEGEEKVINLRIDTIDSNLTTTTSDLKTLSDSFTAEVTRSVDEDTKLLNNIDNAVAKAENDLNQHLVDYANPHKVTAEQVGLGKVDNISDLDKPISVAVQDALNTVDLELAKKATEHDLQLHLLNNTNPHNVSKELVGLGNADNTSDLEKPISLATQDALDKKSDIWHKHVMADIADLENVPLFIDFIETMLELPAEPSDGDRYLMVSKTETSNARYLLFEYDAFYGLWKLKLISTGMIASNINKDMWKLNISGPERILDVSDYKYFYDKIYDETKNLIEDIDWEEDDENSETNNQIRLKITYKTSYGDPNEEEATNPYQTKAVKYIDIEKARFLSNIYSRPARQSDVDNGYATKIGEPMLILVLTTGDYVAVSLKDSLNIYDPIDTASIDMEVTDWTGDPNTSYKVSAVVRLASTKDQETAVSLHILDGTEKGMYATLHTSNTNSISLNPSTGTSGLKTLSANLNINNSLNNNSDVLLTIDSSGLSAKVIWGEYD